MIFDTIRLSNNVDGHVDFKFRNAELSDPYILKNADGLGPPEIDLFISKNANQRSNYQGSSPQNKEIVIRLGLNPDYSLGQNASDIRTPLYRYIQPSEETPLTVQLMFENNVVAQVDGYIKRFETVPFAKDPEIQLTIDCLDSQFVDPIVSLYTGFLNKLEPYMIYDADAPTGFRFQIVFSTAVTNFGINRGTDGKGIYITYPFLSGNTLLIDTQPGSRGIWVKVGTNWFSIINKAVVTRWDKLYPGVNHFYLTSQAYGTHQMTYIKRYWGV